MTFHEGPTRRFLPRGLGHLAPVCLALATVWSAAAQSGMAADEKSPAAGSQKETEQAVIRAINYLRVKGQEPDGSYSRRAGPAVTALVTTALVRHGRTLEDPQVARGLKFLEGFAQPDGGIYQSETVYKNYETCLAIMCFSAANSDGRYAKLIKSADAFIKESQWDGSEGHDESSFSYGGAGYGNKKRPDLSNTSFLIDALVAAGNGPDDDAVKNALVFVSRCQNLESEHNTAPFAARNPDGGFYYTVAADGESQAGKTDNGGLRSYGSMTYAGLKSMIFAGVGPDDPRVKAAVEWLARNYSLDTNPGMGDAGLYYYYHTFAKALDAMGQETFEDADGKIHSWREELAAELVRRQQPDGSWVNENARWLEGDANLVTGYALLALSYCRAGK